MSCSHGTTPVRLSFQVNGIQSFQHCPLMLSHRLNRKVLLQYFVAVCSVALATILRLTLDPLFGEKFPYITFIFAIVANAWYSGMGPSLASMVLGFLSAFYFFASPRGSFQVSGLDGQIGAVTYIVTGVCTIFFFESIRSAERRAVSIAKELRQHQAALEIEITERKKAQEATTHLLRRLVNAQEDERRRISRELHDQCGQDLTALRLELKLLQETLNGNTDAATRLSSLYQVLDRVADEVHHLSLKLRPSVLDELGLATAVSNYIENWKELTGIEVDCEVGGWGTSRINEAVETAFYRVLQEALTNVAKHSQAKSVSVILQKQPQEVVMIVEDNGCGFDVPTQFNGDGPIQHLGLLGMRERMIAAGGGLEIESLAGIGTSVFARVPASQAHGGSK